MDQPIVNLLDFETEDPLATDRAKVEARRASPLIFTPEIGYLDRLQAAIDGLPRAIADRTSIENVNPDLVKAFALTPETLAMVRSYVGEDGTTSSKMDRMVQGIHQFTLAKGPPALAPGLPGIRDDPEQGRTDTR